MHQDQQLVACTRTLACGVFWHSKNGLVDSTRMISDPIVAALNADLDVAQLIAAAARVAHASVVEALAQGDLPSRVATFTGAGEKWCAVHTSGHALTRGGVGAEGTISVVTCTKLRPSSGDHGHLQQKLACILTFMSQG